MRLIDTPGARLRLLRRHRRWTRADLARRLGVSPARVGELERGDAALTVEEFLRVLEVFNVGVEHFAQVAPPREASAVQNALVRLGASHLVAGETLVPSWCADVGSVMSEVLTAPESPRHVTALAPVVVAQVERVNLHALADRLAAIGRSRRVGWLADHLRALYRAVQPPTPAARRAATMLDFFAESLAGQPPDASAPLDVLDADVRSAATARRLVAEGDAVARRWRIVTRLGAQDFRDAWEMARASH